MPRVLSSATCQSLHTIGVAFAKSPELAWSSIASVPVVKVWFASTRMWNDLTIAISNPSTTAK